MARRAKTAAEHDAWLYGNEADDERAAKIAEIESMFDGEGPRVQMNRKEICRAFGLTGYALDELIAQGCPVFKKGNQRTPWILEPDRVLCFIIKKACGLVGGPDATQASVYLAEKCRKMAADADRVEMDNAAKRAVTLTVDEVTAIYREEADLIRRELNAIPAAAVAALAKLPADERRNARTVEDVLDSTINSALGAISSGVEHASA
jgi:phage terminase Nu1 subunit (DNA packaging protein)